jgi:hypothetical protein
MSKGKSFRLPAIQRLLLSFLVRFCSPISLRSVAVMSRLLHVVEGSVVVGIT